MGCVRVCFIQTASSAAMITCSHSTVTQGIGVVSRVSFPPTFDSPLRYLFLGLVTAGGGAVRAGIGFDPGNASVHAVFCLRLNGVDINAKHTG